MCVCGGAEDEGERWGGWIGEKKVSEVRLGLGKCVKSKFMKNTSVFGETNVLFFEVKIDFWKIDGNIVTLTPIF